MSGHPKGPWFVNDQSGRAHPYVEIHGCDGGTQVAYRYAAKPHEVAAFNRIVSCVNALEGLDPAAVADVVAALEASQAILKLLLPNWSHETKAQIVANDTALARIRGEG